MMARHDDIGDKDHIHMEDYVSGPYDGIRERIFKMGGAGRLKL